MGKSKSTGAKRARGGGKSSLAATGNRRLTQQTRKILGKHYANRYRVR